MFACNNNDSATLVTFLVFKSDTDTELILFIKQSTMHQNLHGITAVVSHLLFYIFTVTNGNT